METIWYELCHECACIQVNGSDSVDPNSLTREVLDFMEDHGSLAYAGSEDRHCGYWECESCRKVQWGDVDVFESI